MAQPILSICIPTFNRAKYLNKNLNDLTKLISSDLSDKVEIVVSDNCSPDNTTQVIESYKGKFLKFVPIKNNQNYGYDYNYLQCVARASGEYVWVFSDDDHFVDGCISRLLKILEKRDLCTVILNRSISESYPCFPAYGARMYDIKEDKKGTLLELSREYGFMTLLGLVSGVVIRRPLLDVTDWIRHMNYESALAHLSLTFECYCGMPAMITNEDFLHIETPEEHVVRDHQSKQDPRINFKMWSLNITKFFIDCLDKGVITSQESDLFYWVLHCKMTLADHILGSMESCISEAREIGLNDWTKIINFLNYTGNKEGLKRLEAIQRVHDKLLDQVFTARQSQDFKSMVHNHIKIEENNIMNNFL